MSHDASGIAVSGLLVDRACVERYSQWIQTDKGIRWC
jgi:hypothetical protein